MEPLSGHTLHIDLTGMPQSPCQGHKHRALHACWNHHCGVPCLKRSPMLTVWRLSDPAQASSHKHATLSMSPGFSLLGRASPCCMLHVQRIAIRIFRSPECCYAFAGNSRALPCPNCARSCDVQPMHAVPVMNCPCCTWTATLLQFLKV